MNKLILAAVILSVVLSLFNNLFFSAPLNSAILDLCSFSLLLIYLFNRKKEKQKHK